MLLVVQLRVPLQHPRIGGADRPAPRCADWAFFGSCLLGEHELEPGFEDDHPGPARRPVGFTLALRRFHPTASSNGFSVQMLQSAAEPQKWLD